MSAAVRKLEGCPHVGAAPMMPGTYGAPIGTCRCCGFSFTYINTGMYSRGESRTVTQDSTLCNACGGTPEVHHVKDGTVIQSERGSHGTEPWIDNEGRPLKND